MMTEFIIKRPSAPDMLCPLRLDSTVKGKELIREAMIACSDDCIEKLAGLGKLKADSPTDTVNGYVRIEHGAEYHIYRIVFYDADEAPNGKHSTTFKKPAVMPSKDAVEALL